MKQKLVKFLYTIFASLAIFLLLNPGSLAAPVIRGNPFDTNETAAGEFCWDAMNFGGFCYPVNKHAHFISDGWGERLQYVEKEGNNPLGKNNPENHVIDEEELVYTTVQFPCKYELVTGLGLNPGTVPEELGNSLFYYKLPWFGKPYVAVENDATQLTAVVCSQSGSDRKTLKAGESWDLGKAYSITVQQVDVEGNKVWFSLEKDGEEIESAIIETDGTVEGQTFTATADFGDGNDQLYFLTYVDSVFMGPVDSFAVFKYTWLIDRDNVMLIEAGDEYQGFEVDVAEKEGLTLFNKNSITLNLDKDRKNYFTDSWYFQTSDEGKGSSLPEGYVLYPAKVLDNPGTYKLRGSPFDTNETSADEFSWDAMNFGGFCYPVNKHAHFISDGWGERLQYVEKEGNNPLGKNNPGNHIIDEEELVYSTKQFPCKYELVTGLGLNPGTVPEELGDSLFFYKLPWFGKPYVAVENDATQLTAVVCSQSGSDRKTLKAGESWDLGKAYSITVQQVDVEGNKVWFSLEKDGEEIESAIIETDGTVEGQTFTATADFGDGNDQLYFLTYVDSVFMGPVDSFAVFKYTWLIDKDNVMLIEAGDEYQGFEVDVAEKEGLTLFNKNSITLNLDKDRKNYFTDSWYFQTSDKGKGSTSKEGYVLYPVMDVIIEEKTASDSGVSETDSLQNESEQVEVIYLKSEGDDSESESEGDGAILAAQPKAGPEGGETGGEKSGDSEAAGGKKAPGFELLTAVLGLLVVGVLAGRK